MVQCRALAPADSPDPMRTLRLPQRGILCRVEGDLSPGAGALAFARGSLDRQVLKASQQGTRLATTQPDSGLTDAEIIRRIHSGDEGAMTLLYDRYSSVVYAVALRVLSDSSAAEDILQDVFMQLWRNPQAFNASRGSLAAWLAVIARNRAIDQLRKKRPEAETVETVIAVESDLENTVERNHAIEKVRTVLAGMPAEQRLALEMAFFQGLTHVEIAGKTGQPLGTIKTRIRSGLSAVRKAFVL
jgi:RNA polymerase sigma-70 factor, ECF subfamily